MRRAIVGLAALAAGAAASPLWDYVHTDDGAFSWFDTGVRLDKQAGWTGYLLNMTSQHWLSPLDSNRYTWTHQLLVVVPSVIKNATTGALWITGGDNGQGVPANTDEDTLVCASLATATGTVCGVVYQIPNQPILFPSDPLQKQRSEDAAVAFTWMTYMLGNASTPAEWILYYPMCKAAIKALDAMTQFMPSIDPAVQLQHFITTGASKRGATTWFTGAVDARIIGIAPVVFDILNFEEGLMAMYRTLGGWTFAFTDYHDLNLTSYINTPQMARLAAVVDPLVYSANMTMSKLVIDATGDEFFQVQDDSFWWGRLPGETLRMMVQNAEHSMATGAIELITGMEAWYAALIAGTPRPSFTWQIDGNTGAITIEATGTKPLDVVLRFASTLPPDGDHRRDFRLVAGDTPANPCPYIPLNLFGKACLRPIVWVGESVAPVSSTNDTWTYVLSQPLPPYGWRAVLGELFYPGPPGTNMTFQLTTQVSVIPATYPFEPCSSPAECQGVLV